MIRILLVEDDLGLAGSIIDYLELGDMTCDHAANGVAALNIMQTQRFDVIVLDINLPKMDGLSVCEHTRNEGNDTPIIMLTARDTLDNKLEGFQRGADDYLVKPFDMPELVARVTALAARRSGKAKQFSFGNVRLDINTGMAYADKKDLKLSPTAFKILHVLLRDAGKTISRERLIEAVWKHDAPETNALKVHMHNVRKALDHGNANIEVKTVPGTGFLLVDKSQ